MSTKFSVLASVYDGEKPEYLDQALLSVSNQTLKPTEVVLVRDGPLKASLIEVLEKWKEVLPIKEVQLEENVGLGLALNEGLKNCSNELIIRIDTDDINLPDRFQLQVEYMTNNPNVSVSSSNIGEFDKCTTDCKRYRRVPKVVDKRKLLTLNPINHMACVYRKSHIMAVGNYKDLKFMEDYFLWVRVYENGYKMANIDDCLVYARTGNGMLQRRRGFEYFLSELKFIYYIITQGLTRDPRLISNRLLRAFIRLLPEKMLKLVYIILRTIK